MRKEYFFVILAGILSGFLVFGGQVFVNLGLSLYEVSLFPLLFVVIFLLPFILKKKYRPRNFIHPIWIFYGLVTAITIFAQYGALMLGVPVAIVVLLLYTQPLWTVFISRLFLDEKITKRSLLACFLVLLGVFILINPLDVVAIKNWYGILIALIGGLSLSSWVSIGSFASKTGNQPVTTNFLGIFYTALIMFIVYPLVNLFVKEPSITPLSFNLSLMIWFYLLIFALFIQIGSHLFYLYGVKKVSTVDAGIILLLEPISATILAIIFLNQILTFNIILGGVLILIANYIVIRK